MASQVVFSVCRLSLPDPGVAGTIIDWSIIRVRRCSMRTNIVLDDKLVREAMKLANVKTKREVVDIALRRFIQSGKQRKLLV